MSAKRWTAKRRSLNGSRSKSYGGRRGGGRKSWTRSTPTQVDGPCVAMITMMMTIGRRGHRSSRGSRTVQDSTPITTGHGTQPRSTSIVVVEQVMSHDIRCFTQQQSTSSSFPYTGIWYNWIWYKWIRWDEIRWRSEQIVIRSITEWDFSSVWSTCSRTTSIERVSWWSSITQPMVATPVESTILVVEGGWWIGHWLVGGGRSVVRRWWWREEWRGEWMLRWWGSCVTVRMNPVCDTSFYLSRTQSQGIDVQFFRIYQIRVQSCRWWSWWWWCRIWSVLFLLLLTPDDDDDSVLMILLRWSPDQISPTNTNDGDEDDGDDDDDDDTETLPTLLLLPPSFSSLAMPNFLSRSNIPFFQTPFFSMDSLLDGFSSRWICFSMDWMNQEQPLSS